MICKSCGTPTSALFPDGKCPTCHNIPAPTSALFPDGKCPTCPNIPAPPHPATARFIICRTSDGQFKTGTGERFWGNREAAKTYSSYARAEYAARRLKNKDVKIMKIN